MIPYINPKISKSIKNLEVFKNDYQRDIPTKTVIFTCGYIYDIIHYQQIIIPQLLIKIKEYNIKQHDIFQKLIELQYLQSSQFNDHQNHIISSCPSCLILSLIKEEQRRIKS